MGVPHLYWFDELAGEVPEAGKFAPQAEESKRHFYALVESETLLFNENQELKQKIIDVSDKRRHIENLQSQMWDRASSYTNLIMSAGYAALFAAWAGTRGDLDARLAAAILLSALLSLAAFVLWEVYKMLLASKTNNGLIAVIMADQENFHSRVEKFQKFANVSNRKGQLLWRPVLIWTIATGLCSAALLIYGIVRTVFV